MVGLKGEGHHVHFADVELIEHAAELDTIGEEDEALKP
jgi:hypothetical protein